jgi:transposase
MVYVNSDKGQTYLMPQNIADLFPKNHVCYLIEQIAESMDYSKFDLKYEGAGRPAYHPRVLIKILMMAGVDGIRSSRKISKNTHENVVYIYLAEKTHPDFRTICNFKNDNPVVIKEISWQLNKFAYKHGLIDLSHLMIDGTTIKADANNNRILDKETIEKLRDYIDREYEKSLEVDKEEDELYGDRGMHELPEEFNDSEKRRPIIGQIVKKINQAINKKNDEEIKEIKGNLNHINSAMEKQKLKKYSPTDPDARFMLNKKGRVELCYNGQIVTDKNGLIIADDVVQNSDDRHQLVPGVEKVEEQFGKLAEGTKVSADAGYENGEQMQILDERGFDLYIPGKFTATTEARQKKFSKAKFNYDEKQDVYVCPENKLLRNVGSYYRKKEQRHLTIYKCSDCLNCPNHDECVGKKTEQRSLHAVAGDKLFNRIKEKLKTKEGKAVYKLRQQRVERSFGDLKHNKNFRTFFVRGIEKVKTEFKLGCIIHNLVLINNLINKKPTPS